MDVSGFIERLQGAGVTLAVEGGNLAVSPASRLSDAERQFIKAQKAAILAALNGMPAPRPALTRIMRLRPSQKISKRPPEHGRRCLPGRCAVAIAPTRNRPAIRR
jgi:hypothetical protein